MSQSQSQVTYNEKDFVRVPVELWNKWMQEREDWRNECERLRRELDWFGTKIETLEDALWRECNGQALSGK